MGEDLKAIGEIKIAIGEIKIRDAQDKMRVRGVLLAIIQKEAPKEIGEIKIAIGVVKMRVTIPAMVVKEAREATNTAAAKEATSTEVDGDHGFLLFFCASTTMPQNTNKPQA